MATIQDPEGGNFLTFRLDQGWGEAQFDSACKRAGLYNFHFHDLRHSAASFMAMGGIDLLSIGKILGHKTLSMTQRYAHLSPGHLRNAVAAIGAAMSSNQTPTSQFTSQSAFLPPQQQRVPQ